MESELLGFSLFFLQVGAVGMDANHDTTGMIHISSIQRDAFGLCFSHSISRISRSSNITTLLCGGNGLVGWFGLTAVVDVVGRNWILRWIRAARAPHTYLSNAGTCDGNWRS